MSVFNLSPLHSRKMDTYSIGSTDLREDALDDMMHRICLSSEESELLECESEQEQLRRWADHFIHAMSPEGQNRHTANVNPNPADVFQYNPSTPIDQVRPMPTRPIVDEYNYFNLQNIKAPVPPKWKDNDNILEDFRKFHHSCIHLFDGPMAHIASGKVKINMFLIWAGRDNEDIYENLQLSSSQ